MPAPELRKNIDEIRKQVNGIGKSNRPFPGVAFFTSVGKGCLKCEKGLWPVHYLQGNGLGAFLYALRGCLRFRERFLNGFLTGPVFGFRG